jgi:response regulator RpfG family c-di-GMP phosphodiesterase
MGGRGEWARALGQTQSSIHTTRSSHAPRTSCPTLVASLNDFPGCLRVPASRHAPTRLLVVDDEPTIHAVLARSRRRLGWELTSARTLAEARAWLGRAQFDVILLDLVLEGECGSSLLAELQALAPRTLTIIMTAMADGRTRSGLLRQGAFDCLCKPVTLAELSERVELARGYRDRAMAGSADRGSWSVRRDGGAATPARADQAEVAVKQVVCALAEMRHAETGSHLRRIGHYSSLLAGALPEATKAAGGVDEAYIGRLAEAAPLHDIGKVGIPDSVLLKPGPLTEVERRAIEQHPRIGCSLLQTARQCLDGLAVPIIDMGADICTSHHERYDGGGYPAGLRREQIPLSARIVAVADVYDALTTPRPYRQKPMPLHIARAIVVAESGKAFDPAVIEAFTLAEPMVPETTDGTRRSVAVGRPDRVDDLFVAPPALPASFTEAARALGLVG